MQNHLSADGETASCRVLILEKSAFDREGVVSFLRPHRDIEIIGIAADAASAMHIIARHSPDAVIVTFSDDTDALRIVREIVRRAPGLQILAIIPRIEPAAARLMRSAGATQLLMGPQRPAAVVTAVRELGPVSAAPKERPYARF